MKPDVSVIGLGKVGLPLAILIASKNFRICGIDIDRKKLLQIKNKEITIEDSFTHELFKKINLNLENEIKRSDIYIVCVPTSIDEYNQPNLAHIINAVENIGRVLDNNQLIIIESTIYPGLCEEVIIPILNKTGKKYLLAHCPERINPGDKEWNIANIPRVIGALNKRSLQKATNFYKKILTGKITTLSDLRHAEATKILENVFRDVNIALVNEMAQSFYRMGIDIKEVIEAASTKPFGFLPHFPGVGVGGDCIAVNPYYMIERGKVSGFDHELLKTARKINTYMPIYTINLLQNSLNFLGLALKGKRIGIYGMSYKPNTSDTRESPAFEVIKRLKILKMAKVNTYDPFVLDSSTVKSLTELLNNSEAVIVCTAHDEIAKVDPMLFKKHKIKLIIDGRNCLDKNKIKSLGILYKGIGRE